MNSTKETVRPRWSDYFFARGDGFLRFWKEYLRSSTKRVMLVAGLGFDPRTCHGLEALLEAGARGRLDCVVIEYDE